jgi:hypothetical protein
MFTPDYSSYPTFSNYFSYPTMHNPYNQFPTVYPYSVSPYRPYTPSPIPPPGLGYIDQSTGKTALVESLRKVILANNGIIFGNFIANEIYYDQQKKEQNQHQHTHPHPHPHLQSKGTSNGIETRFGNKMDILIWLHDCQNMMTEIIKSIEPLFQMKVEAQYSIQEKYPLIGELNANNEDKQMYCITLSFKSSKMTTPFNLIIYIATTNATLNSPEMAGCELTMPLGILDFQYEYLSFSNSSNGYALLGGYPIKCDTESDMDKTLTQYEIIVCIQKGIRVFLSHIQEETIWEYIEKIKKESHGESVYLDYMISPRKKLDYFIEIVGSRVAVSNCSKCNVDISGSQVCCISKCCKQRMHTSCMLEHYLTEDKPIFKCNKCVINRTDKFGKNSSILLWDIYTNIFSSSQIFK